MVYNRYRKGGGLVLPPIEILENILLLFSQMKYLELGKA